MNHKEHHMINIAEFLVDGEENLQGHPEINIIFSEEFHEAAEMFTLTFDLAALSTQPSKSERQLEFFTSFWKRHQSVPMLQHDRLMGNSSSSATARPSTSPIAVDGSEGGEVHRGEAMGLGQSCSRRPRDPRSQTTQWPCNKWAQWRHCSICALRLGYVPSLGSPASSTSQPNPGTVAQALKELKNMMEPLPPTESMVRVMIDKVTAEHRLSVMMDQHKMEMEKAMGKVNVAKLMFQKGHSKGNKGYSKPEVSEGPHVGSPSSSPDWEKMTPPVEHKEMDPTRQCYQQPRGRCGVRAGLQQPAVADDGPAPSKSLPLRIGQSAVNVIQQVYMPFDLYRAETYEVLKTVFQRQRPKKIWISPMCTLWCGWTDLNFWHRPEELNKKRRRERQMLRRLVAFLLWITYMDPTVELYWEWPRRNRGWKDPIVDKFFTEQLPGLGREVWDCRLDGCRFNMKTDDGMFIQGMDSENH
eukprot:s2780_g2.t1